MELQMPRILVDDRRGLPGQRRSVSGLWNTIACVLRKRQGQGRYIGNIFLNSLALVVAMFHYPMDLLISHVVLSSVTPRVLSLILDLMFLLTLKLLNSVHGWFTSWRPFTFIAFCSNFKRVILRKSNRWPALSQFYCILLSKSDTWFWKIKTCDSSTLNTHSCNTTRCQFLYPDILTTIWHVSEDDSDMWLNILDFVGLIFEIKKLVTWLFNF